ncbi:3-oxoacyl-[acyl-carrier-protein] synthase III C-terminal domain-containing protein [Pseudoalteromonas sp. S16_S37]|uniref:3-oxoacyl-[acyl-carrier-protein] synthase III C-terminal domain-containing protein n=1 Tax=Pseudoalteromonas sp. S16_S37 TaxID=2720228 RepID=UPI001680BA5F|nr:3-oxoacyl-[acyl-carrier-protein] synthase III C-terminal domain-containing protein [Pseudoalteromonas sp. S16_S37]MBD1584445.1 hypothetical protein [Pseudoalteromonas sp. S16_S37]
MLYLNDIKKYIPKTQSIFELSHRYGLSEMELNIYHRLYGLDRIPVSDEPFDDITVQYCEQLLEDNNVDRTDVKLLIFCHTVSQFQPFSQTWLTSLKTRLGLDNAIVFGMNTNKCANPSFALDIINTLIGDCPSNKAIILTSDVAHNKEAQIIKDSTILGDAFALSLYSREEKGFELVSNTKKVYGQHAACSWEEGETLTEFQDEYATRLSETLSEALELADTSYDQIKAIVPHNVNIISWKRVADASGFPSSKIYFKNIAKTAHCFGSDTFINLESMLLDDLLERGDLLLSGNAGLGATFNGILWRYVG